MRSLDSSRNRRARFFQRLKRNLRDFWGRFSRNQLAVASLVLILVFAVLAILASTM
jgi:ABC-type antimicrobial peptide transport system permease subunit